MPSTSYNKFEQRLALVAYYNHLFGVNNPNDADSVRSYHTELNALKEGYNPEGRSYVFTYLSGRVRGIDYAELLAYDENIRRHTEAINHQRSEPITFKYFQVLAALKSEHYLGHVTTDFEGLLRDLNGFIEAQNAKKKGRISFPEFDETDLNKVAYWMATGSGKTLLLHLNYYQYLHYMEEAGQPIDHILLVTPNEGLSEQHIAEMKRSGVPCCRFSEAVSGLFDDPSRLVKVIEITKLVEEKTDSGVRVETSAFEGRNLVFVDEGHKGSGSEAGTWRNIRADLADRGFTFEYSATFGQAVSGSTVGASVEEEYARAILVDYSYPRFYKDGYGKDYRILNLEKDFGGELTKHYLLANLLTFYEQIRIYRKDGGRHFDEYNLMSPLMMFVGHTVNTGKTSSQLGAEDKRTLSDVQTLTRFLHDVLTGNDWVPEAIEAVLEGTADLLRPDGEDLFVDAFQALRKEDRSGAEIYGDLLQKIFHVSGPTGLHLVNLKTSQGEIGLRAGATDQFFGVINIGDDINFLAAAEKDLPDVIVEESATEASLFKAINSQDSPVQILIGAKKFIEGWSSWRVSTMGLMNIGRGEGPQIIQLFGRGVRLKGKNSSLKRSSALVGSGPHPESLALLETLNIFGVRAKYMAQFRDYLADEGIDTDARETLYIPTRIEDDFLKKGLLTLRPRVGGNFENDVRLELALEKDASPRLDLTPQMDVLMSRDETVQTPTAGSESDEGPTEIPQMLLPLLNWDRLYRDVWQFRTSKEYTNLLIDQHVLRDIISEGYYQLTCPASVLECKRYTDLERVEGLVRMILRKYVSRFYSQAKRRWEKEHLSYVALEAEDSNLIHTIEARVKRSASVFLSELEAMLEDARLYESEEGRPPRVYFDRHLYLPLVEEDQADVVQYSPTGLNRGEANFVRDLRDFVESDDGRKFMANKELYLLRNLTRGRGVGFETDEGTYFPDFIFWLKTSDRQHISFIDPKGLLMAMGRAHPKVQLHRDIKDYERILNVRAGRDNVILHAFLISQTPYDKLSYWEEESIADFNDIHIFFREQDGYIKRLLDRVIADVDELVEQSTPGPNR